MLTLLHPLALALAALAIPIVLLYVLKIRRQAYAVSSTLLWRRALEDVRANTPWQRLRRNLLLILQLLALLTLVMALAQPAYSRTTLYAGDTIVVVDESYGMLAHDVVPSRFAVAVRRARGMARDLGSGHVLSVIGMGAQPRLIIADSSDGSAIDNALAQARPGPTAPNLLGAMTLAAGLVRTGQNTRVVVLTSRDSGITALPVQLRADVEIVRIGGRPQDLAIAGFDAVRGGSHVHALVRLVNFGSSAATSDVQLYADGRLADVRPVRLTAGSDDREVWDDLPATVKTLHVVLTRRDDLAEDKSAWAIVHAAERRSIVLITKGDYFLERALVANPALRVRVVAPSAYWLPLSHGVDLTIFDGMSPTRLPSGPALLISPQAGRVGPFHIGRYEPVASLSADPSLTAPTLLALTNNVDLSDVHLARAHRLDLSGDVQPIITADGFPVVAAGEAGGRRLGIIAFNLEDSDWPLRISFPLFLQRLAAYLTPSIAPSESTAGEAVTLRAYGARALTITRPDGAVDRLTSPFPPFTDTEQAGIYRVRAVEGSGGQEVQTRFVVNFPATRARAVTGPSVLRFGPRLGRAQESHALPADVTWVCGLLALALLVIEWGFALRR